MRKMPPKSPARTPILTINDLAFAMMAVQDIPASSMLAQHPDYERSVRRFRAAYDEAQRLQAEERTQHGRKAKLLRFALGIDTEDRHA